MHNQYNAEIKHFNFILSQYDNKIKENYEVINSIYRSNINSVQREESSAFLMKQLNDLVNEKQENIITINELKANIIKLQTEIKLLNYNKSITKPTKNIPDKESKEIISQLNKKIDELENTIRLSQINNNASTTSGVYSNRIDQHLNDCLLNAIKTIKSKDKEIEQLNARYNKIKGKYVIDANSSIHSDKEKNNQIENLNER